MENKSPDLSVVVPAFNEEGNIGILWEKLYPAVKRLGQSFEIIFVDDGSKDKTFEILSELRSKNPELCIVKLRRNYGQHPATIAGFEHARGKWILTLDADLQNNPDDLQVIFNKLKEGYDVVSGVRVHRKDALLRRKLPSKIVNQFIAKRTGFVQTDTGCFLKGYTQRAAREIAEYTDIGGFITATISVLGFKYVEVPVSHAEREHGQSRYGILTQLDQFMSLFTGYARRPFQIIELVGLVFAFIGFITIVAALGGFILPRIHTALLGAILLCLGLLLGSVGIVGEYVVRIFKLSRNSPRYLVAEVLQ